MSQTKYRAGWTTFTIVFVIQLLTERPIVDAAFSATIWAVIIQTIVKLFMEDSSNPSKTVGKRRKDIIDEYKQQQLKKDIFFIIIIFILGLICFHLWIES